MELLRAREKKTLDRSSDSKLDRYHIIFNTYSRKDIVAYLCSNRSRLGIKIILSKLLGLWLSLET